jgi:hypothetical protein
LLHRKENLEENIEYTNVTNEKQISQKQAFRESISDMTQYSNFTNQNIKVKNHKEKENEKEER